MTELMHHDEQAMVELAVQEQPEMMVPFVGELIDLRDPQQVAAGLQHVRDAKNHLDRVRQLLESVLRLEAMRQGTKTLHLGRLDAVVTGGVKVEYDGEELIRLLEAAGMPEDRVLELVVPVVTYKVNATKAKAAAAANPAYAEALGRTRTVVETPWRVSIKPS
jgi:hypothetical protein